MSSAASLTAPSTAEIDAELARRHLRDFVPLAWPVVDSHHFRPNWHIDAICDHLEAVSHGEIKRLVINIPPRHMKSLAVAVFWPCWDWLSRPGRQWLYASYAEKLSKRDSLKCRRLIEHKGGRVEGGTLIERLGYRGMLNLLGEDWELTGDQNEKLRFENDRTGYRIATSIGGTATGEGGDILVLDDPHKADEVESETQRDNVIDWIDGTLPTRLNDPNTGAIVVVMQRVHEEDATGHLLEQGGYEHLCLPAEYEPSHPFVWPDDPRTEPGELLWPEHFGSAAVEDLNLRLGIYRAAGQLQQRPAPAEGGILKRGDWRYYPPSHVTPEGWEGPHFERIWQSWDTALKEKTTSDFTVGTLWGQQGANKFLIRRARGRWGLTETIEQVRALTAWAARYFPGMKAHEIQIENAANGPEVVAALRNEIPGLRPITADRDKVVRAHAITPQLNAGNVYVPGYSNAELSGPDPTRTPSWVQELIDECAGFPNTSNDDQVDAVTQALDPRHEASQPVTQKRKGRTEMGGLLSKEL